MFKCFVTKRVSKPREKTNKLVTKRRERIYYGWFLNEETDQMERQEIGRGWEIVEEVNVTAEGLRVWKELQNNNLGAL